MKKAIISVGIAIIGGIIVYYSFSSILDILAQILTNWANWQGVFGIC